jgi:hypothetical protein
MSNRNDKLRQLEGMVKSTVPKKKTKKAPKPRISKEQVFNKWLIEYLESQEDLDPVEIAKAAFDVGWAEAMERGRRMGQHQSRWASRRK